MFKTESSVAKHVKVITGVVKAVKVVQTPIMESQSGEYLAAPDVAPAADRGPNSPLILPSSLAPE